MSDTVEHPPLGDSEGDAAEQESPQPPHTGNPAVDRVLAEAARIEQLPVAERAAAFHALHGELEAVLSREPGPAAPAEPPTSR